MKKNNIENALVEQDPEVLLSGLTPEQRKQLADRLFSAIADDDIEANREAQKREVIEDFNDPRVDPLSAGAIYEIYNYQSKTFTQINGMHASCKFSSNNKLGWNDASRFQRKELGSRIEINNKNNERFRLKFLFYETLPVIPTKIYEQG